MKQKDTIIISLIGDIFPGELPYTQNYGIRSQFEKHKGVPWIRKIKKIVGENDIVVGNLESPLVAEVDTIKKTFFGDPEFVCVLKECGINVLNVANNHIMEQGNQGFQSTIQALNKAELGIVGHIIDSKSKIIYKDVKGLKIAIAGISNVDLHVIQNDNHFSV
jgi:poly-gamma-glutamate synthesis protein (capsule biosynthesis protein)